MRRLLGGGEKRAGEAVAGEREDLCAPDQPSRSKGAEIVVRLADGREISFPIALNRKLREAEPAKRAKLEIICGGTGLHWPDLDEDLSVLGILEGRLGRA